jgi:hypothetical protein
MKIEDEFIELHAVEYLAHPKGYRTFEEYLMFKWHQYQTKLKLKEF